MQDFKDESRITEAEEHIAKHSEKTLIRKWVTQ